MTCQHSYEIRSFRAVFIEPAEEWVPLTGPFFRNQKNERCIAYEDTYYSIEGAVEEKTVIVCHDCNEELV